MPRGQGQNHPPQPRRRGEQLVLGDKLIASDGEFILRGPDQSEINFMLPYEEGEDFKMVVSKNIDFVGNDGSKYALGASLTFAHSDDPKEAILETWLEGYQDNLEGEDLLTTLSEEERANIERISSTVISDINKVAYARDLSDILALEKLSKASYELEMSERLLLTYQQSLKLLINDKEQGEDKSLSIDAQLEKIAQLEGEIKGKEQTYTNEIKKLSPGPLKLANLLGIDQFKEDSIDSKLAEFESVFSAQDRAYFGSLEESVSLSQATDLQKRFMSAMKIIEQIEAGEMDVEEVDDKYILEFRELSIITRALSEDLKNSQADPAWEANGEDPEEIAEQIEQSAERFEYLAERIERGY